MNAAYRCITTSVKSRFIRGKAIYSSPEFSPQLTKMRSKGRTTLSSGWEFTPPQPLPASEEGSKNKSHYSLYWHHQSVKIYPPPFRVVLPEQVDQVNTAQMCYA